MAYIKNSALVVIFLISAAFAPFHHGWSNYNQDKVNDFKTVIEESTYENPHALAKVKFKGEQWTIYLAPASRMTARGVTAEMIKKGTPLRMVAYPHKTVKNEMRAERIFINGEKYELR